MVKTLDFQEGDQSSHPTRNTDIMWQHSATSFCINKPLRVFGVTLWKPPYQTHFSVSHYLYHNRQLPSCHFFCCLFPPLCSAVCFQILTGTRASINNLVYPSVLFCVCLCPAVTYCANPLFCFGGVSHSIRARQETEESKLRKRDYRRRGGEEWQKDGEGRRMEVRWIEGTAARVRVADLHGSVIPLSGLSLSALLLLSPLYGS